MSPTTVALAMLIIIIACILINKIPMNFIMFLVPLVLHPNKSYLEAERKRLAIRSDVVTLSLLVSVIVLNIFWNF